MTGETCAAPDRSSAPPRRDWLPVAPLRAAFADSGLTLAEVARRAGSDHAQVGRVLGNRVSYSGRRDRKAAGPHRRRYVLYPTAVRLARAMGLDPVDLDL